ncbi:hypothetical protein [Poseidonocella sp. HB161398]|uniref:hypothetical protein n=1 Tax=Poseidonocella sp. HB161398 TaxID=2320855 RepID=UPI001109DEC5|nr:hypothetical protein [Poseidonocella sp. HB161398]
MHDAVKLNVARLIEDCGGPRQVAIITGKSRTAPYRWIKTGYLAAEHLAAIKAACPTLDLDAYFEPA